MLSWRRSAATSAAVIGSTCLFDMATSASQLGHVSVCIEMDADPMQIGTQVKLLVNS